jgi:hypothetical protein
MGGRSQYSAVVSGHPGYNTVASMCHRATSAGGGRFDGMDKKSRTPQQQQQQQRREFASSPAGGRRPGSAPDVGSADGGAANRSPLLEEFRNNKNRKFELLVRLPFFLFLSLCVMGSLIGWAYIGHRGKHC